MDRRRYVAYNRRFVRSEIQKAFVLVTISLYTENIAQSTPQCKGASTLTFKSSWILFLSYTIYNYCISHRPRDHHPRTHGYECLYTKGFPNPKSQTAKQVPKMHRPSQQNTGVIHAHQITKVVTKKKEKQPEEVRLSLAFMIKSSRVYWPFYSKESPKTPLSRAMQSTRKGESEK